MPLMTYLFSLGHVVRMVLASRVGLAPLPDALDLGRAAEIIPVVGLLMPPVLAGRLAGLAARRLGAVALVPDVARVRSKEGPTVLALPFAEWTSHEPEEMQAYETSAQQT